MSLFAINLTFNFYNGASPAQHQEKRRTRKPKKKKKKGKKHTFRRLFSVIKHLVMYGLRPPG